MVIKLVITQLTKGVQSKVWGYTLSKVVGSWHDCINPLGLPAHAHFFEINDTISIYYANKICPLCWERIQPDRTHNVLAAPGWFEKKYPSRNDKADMLPSSTYDDWPQIRTLSLCLQSPLLQQGWFLQSSQGLYRGYGIS